MIAEVRWRNDLHSGTLEAGSSARPTASSDEHNERGRATK